MMFTGTVRCTRTGMPLADIPMTDGKNIVKTNELLFIFCGVISPVRSASRNMGCRI